MHAQEYIDLVKSTLDALDPKSLDQLVDAFHSTYSKGGNIYTMGNGGSGASASHAAGDFLKGASYGLDKRFKMICLNRVPVLRYRGYRYSGTFFGTL